MVAIIPKQIVRARPVHADRSLPAAATTPSRLAAIAIAFRLH